ncbi:MAG: hypothetical protein ABH919_03970 [bacterium]
MSNNKKNRTGNQSSSVFVVTSMRYDRIKNLILLHAEKDDRTVIL